MSLYQAAVTWRGSSGVVKRHGIAVATLGRWSIDVEVAFGAGVVGTLTAPVVTGADAIETRDGWTVDLLAGNGVRWLWENATLTGRSTWKLSGLPTWTEASTDGQVSIH